MMGHEDFHESEDKLISEMSHIWGQYCEEVTAEIISHIKK